MSKQQNTAPSDISLTDILQAHDILLSILLGKTIAKYDKPNAAIAQILEIIDYTILLYM